MHAGGEANRRGFGKIPGRAADFPDWITKSDDLCEYLVIKKEIIRVFFQRQAFKKGTGESAVAAVILRQFGAEQKILNQGENPVRDIFPPGHPAAQRAPAEDA